MDTAQNASGTGRFQVVGNKILDPYGNLFIIKGVDMVFGRFAGGDASGYGLSNYNTAARDLDVWKGMGGNAIRLSLNLRGVNTNNQWGEGDNVINLATERDILVIISQTNSTDTTGTIANWLQAMAGRYKSNPYVWIKPANEPHGGSQSWPDWQREHSTWVQAIRAGGNTAPIVLNSPGWSWSWAQYPNHKINDPSIILGPHIYANGATSFTPSRVDWAALSSSYPVMVDEVGNYDDGAPNPAGSATWNQEFFTFLAEWLKNQGGVGCLAFTWYWSDANTLTDGNNNLNQWGQAYRTHLLTPLVSYSPQSTWRINAGSTSSYTDSNGHIWQADTGITGGSMIDRGNISIANTLNPRIFQTEHYGMASATYAVPNGTYTVNLHFAETYYTAVGKRVFNVGINGTQVLSNFDVCAQVGANTALFKSFPVSVTNGQITITFTAITNNPEINGIQILP